MPKIKCPHHLAFELIHSNIKHLFKKLDEHINDCQAHQPEEIEEEDKAEESQKNTQYKDCKDELIENLELKSANKKRNEQIIRLQCMLKGAEETIKERDLEIANLKGYIDSLKGKP